MSGALSLGVVAQQAMIDAAAGGTPTPSPSGISFVGGKTVLHQGTATSTSFDFNGLTGGSDSSPSVGDFVVLVAAASNFSFPNMAFDPLPTGLSLHADEHDADSTDTRQQVYGGVYEAGTASGGTYDPNTNQDGGCIHILVFRGCSGFGETPVTNERNNGTTITPASITPTVAGSWVLVGASAGHGGGAVNWNDPGTYDRVFNDTGNDTYDASLFVGIEESPVIGSAYNPAQMKHPENSFGNCSVTITFVIRPS